MGVAKTVEHRNEVVVIGRVSGAAEQRIMPSGDVLVTMRLVVDRPLVRQADRLGQASQTSPTTRTPGINQTPRPRQPTVDTIDCVAWRADVRRNLLAYATDDVVQLHGSLRRRFWRTGAGAAVSRSEVEVL